MSTKKLAEHGKRLPIGYVDEAGEAHRTFALREWDWDLEERIGEELESTDVGAMQHVTQVVACATKAIGKVDFAKLNHIQRLGLISRMYYSDVLMIYVWIRIESLGHALRLETFTCERCRKPIDFVGDLRELDVKEIDVKHISRTVTLEKGVKYAGDVRKKLRVEPLRWAFFESSDFAAAMGNQAKFKLLAMQHGVAEVEGAPTPACVTREHVKTMSPREVMRVVREIDQCGGGVVMAIEGECPHCKAAFEKEIDWRYGDFFGRSVP